jgi:hypothetical protein
MGKKKKKKKKKKKSARKFAVSTLCILTRSALVLPDGILVWLQIAQRCFLKKKLHTFRNGKAEKGSKALGKLPAAQRV